MPSLSAKSFQDSRKGNGMPPAAFAAGFCSHALRKGGMVEELFSESATIFSLRRNMRGEILLEFPTYSDCATHTKTRYARATRAGAAQSTYALCRMNVSSRN